MDADDFGWSHRMSRRDVVRRGTAISLAGAMVGGVLVPATAGQAQGAQPSPTGQAATPKEPLPSALVKQFVAVAHGDLAKTRELLDSEPGLINACHDWGAGDFETALGAASHTGRREIAELLLSRGARLDLFGAAMLGHLSTVQAILAHTPSLALCKGPHGIPLLQHAVVGGEQSREVAEFLKALDT